MDIEVLRDAMRGVEGFQVRHVYRPTEDPAQDVAGLRIAVIGINYSPEVTGIAPYTTAMCEDLVYRGAQVEALVGLPHYPEWRVHPDFAGPRGDTEEINGVIVHRAKHHVPDNMTAVTRGHYEASFMRSALKRSRRLGAPDVVVAVVPALSSALVAERLARRLGVPYAVIVQDLVGKAATQSGIKGGARLAGMVARAERFAVRRAAGVAAISLPISAAVQAYGVPTERIAHLPNYTHITVPALSQAEARARLGWPADRFIALHTGNMGLKQDLENVVNAARLVDDSDSPLEFRLIGDGSQRRNLEESARGLRRIVFQDPLPADGYVLALRAADVLLVNERSTVDDMSLPSKLTSYLVARRPVVAAVPFQGATAGLVEESGGGLVVVPNDPVALVDALGTLMADAIRREELGERGNVYAQTRLTRSRGLAATRAFVVRAALSAA